jgi:hypothetical protein
MRFDAVISNEITAPRRVPASAYAAAGSTVFSVDVHLM